MSAHDKATRKTESVDFMVNTSRQLYKTGVNQYYVIYKDHCMNDVSLQDFVMQRVVDKNYRLLRT